MRTSDLLALNERGGNAFLLFLAPRRGEEEGRPRIHDLETICQRVADQLNRKLSEFTSPYLRGKRKVTVGYAVVFHNPLIMAERVVARLVGEAWESVRIQKMQADFQTRCRLQDVLLGHQITTVFQPIVNLLRGGLLGFEALSRGPAGTQAHSPINLFEAAEGHRPRLRARPPLPPPRAADGARPAPAAPALRQRGAGLDVRPGLPGHEPHPAPRGAGPFARSGSCSR